jgi:hypothetical protein
MPWIRVCISWEKPAITALTTIIVATPSVTLITLASGDPAGAEVAPAEEEGVHSRWQAEAP